MRCPKCGYISFDHVDSCLKCNKKISGAGDVEGTTFHAAAPSFLRVPEKDTPVEENAASTEVEFEPSDDAFDFSDPDLDVLVDDGEEFSVEGSDDEAALSFDETALEGGEDDYQLESGDDEIDFSFDLDEQAAAPPLNVPEELVDVSDLAPPEPTQVASSGLGDDMSISLDDEQSLDEDLDLDGLDLNLGQGGETQGTDEEVSLSLDDIDFSVEEDSEMDDLGMDLSLDELGESTAPKKDKLGGELDGISLSLD